ncbi:zinc finger protein-domain-containing protein [Penicillium hetheringtonii]|uniref:Zinc finger protein-domain-containing protein n=1 Tax=Penicillium hetheringtonii TaxID=911720 RepID=A0AAD6DRM1_9EURO|nr:zinc finger protein-domain-containing protein [Penicillium hetheringtonii]
MDSLRRIAQHSSEDSPISLTSSMCADINIANKLSALLDRHHNETVINDLDLHERSSPDTILARVLTPKSYSSTASSFALFQQRQQSIPSVDYRVIGFGQCGLVFERPGQGHVLKIARRPYEDALWNDFRAHCRVQHAFKSGPIECRVPMVFSYVPKDNTGWWDKNIALFPSVHESVNLPGMTLISEKILPLPKIARQALIEKYCSEDSRASVAEDPKNRDCLARLYLGRRRANPTPPVNFALRNFNLHLDQMLELGYPVEKLAVDIAEALATIHWVANVDSYDIEFVLGSEGEKTYSHDLLKSLNIEPDDINGINPHTDFESLLKMNFMRRTTRLWVLDFNLCNVWNEETAIHHPETLVSHLVEAFYENDPYFPLPLMDNPVDQSLWTLFSESYLTKATAVLRDKDERLASLPQQFIDRCIQRERINLEKGLGHGHRDLKQ